MTSTGHRAGSVVHLGRAGNTLCGVRCTPNRIVVDVVAAGARRVCKPCLRTRKTIDALVGAVAQTKAIGRE